MRIRILVFTLAACVMASSARAQFVVIDPDNLAQAILIAERTLREYNMLVQQYQTITRMSVGLGSLGQYRIPTIGITTHDVSRYPYGGPWLQGLNSGDPGGELYRQTARQLERPGSLLGTLPNSARQSVQDASATIEITDSIAEIAGHQVALVRGYSGVLQKATQALETDVLNTSAGYGDMTAVLDKIAAGELLARRQDMASNQLLSHVLEQLLARNKRERDTEAAAMNMLLVGMRDGATVGANLLRGAANDLRTWRQP